jgi:predicted RNA-binding protein with PIN domain
MSVPFLIIDGYNLMHASGLARSTYGPGDLARQRHLLLVKLSRLLTAEERKRCTIVFDAIDAPADLPGRFKHEEMIVRFAERGHEADEMIETLIRQHSAPRRLMVVSSDHRIQTAINRRRGTAIDSDIFLKQLESPYRQVGSPQPASSQPKDPSKELEFWIEEFEGIQPAKLEQDLQSQTPDQKSDWERQIDQLESQLQDPDRLDKWLNEPPPH